MATSGSFNTTKCEGRYLTFSWSVKSQSVANNTTTISWKLVGAGASGYVTCGNFKVVIAGSTVYSSSDRVNVYAGTVIASDTKTIKHSSDGTKSFSASAEAGIYTIAVNCDGEGTWTLPTIARESTLSVSNGTLGTKQEITVTKQNSSFTHSIKYVCGSLTGYIKDDGSLSSTEVKFSDASIEWTPPIDWAKQNTSGKNVAVTFTITTYNGSTKIGSRSPAKIYYFIPEEVAPEVTISVSDPTGYAKTYGGYVQGRSKMQIALTITKAQNSAIQSQKVTADGKSYTTANFTTPVISSGSDFNISAQATDGRDRTGTATKPITVIPYSSPVIKKLTVQRCDDNNNITEDGANCLVTYSFNITALSDKNAKTITLEYKQSGVTTWTPVELPSVYSASSATYKFAAAVDSTYDVTLRIEDSFTYDSKSVSLPTTVVITHYRADGDGIAFGQFSTKEDAFECGWNMYDKFGARIGNGVADYDYTVGAGATTEHLTITASSSPTATPYYILTFFETNKSYKKAQLAIPYQEGEALYYRYYDGSSWSAWKRAADEEHNHPYVSTAGGFRFGRSLLQMYNEYEDAVNNTNRCGWIGYNAGDIMVLQDNAGGGINLKSAAAMRFYGAGSSTFIAVLSDRMRASKNDTYYLGDSSYKWKAVYAVNGTIQTSDRNQKTNIQALDERYIALFEKLLPVSFEFKDAESDRVHIGFISQDVKAAMDEVGLTDLDFAGYCRDVLTEWNEEAQEEKPVLDENGEPVYVYSLRYSEFIALNSRMIQLNRQKLAEQEKAIQALSDELTALKEAVAKLSN